MQTERITLVPLADVHLEWEVELDSDPEVMRYLSGGASTREEVEPSHARRMAAGLKVNQPEALGWGCLFSSKKSMALGQLMDSHAGHTTLDPPRSDVRGALTRTARGR